MRRAIWVLGLLLLGLVSLSAARANEGDDREAIRAHRKAIFQILVKRMENVRHPPTTGIGVTRFMIGRDGVVTRSEIHT